MTLRTMCLAAALALAGCATIGPNYDPAAVARLTPGMSKAEVIAMLGRPTSTVRQSDGRQQLMWVHATGHIGGAESRAVMLMFGPDDVYLGLVTSSETNIR